MVILSIRLSMIHGHRAHRRAGDILEPSKMNPATRLTEFPRGHSCVYWIPCTNVVCLSFFPTHATSAIVPFWGRFVDSLASINGRASLSILNCLLSRSQFTSLQFFGLHNNDSCATIRCISSTIVYIPFVKNPFGASQPLVFPVLSDSKTALLYRWI